MKRQQVILEKFKQKELEKNETSEVKSLTCCSKISRHSSHQKGLTAQCGSSAKSKEEPAPLPSSQQQSSGNQLPVQKKPPSAVRWPVEIAKDQVSAFIGSSSSTMRLRYRNTKSSSEFLSMPSTGISQNKTVFFSTKSGRSTCLSGSLPSS